MLGHQISGHDRWSGCLKVECHDIWCIGGVSPSLNDDLELTIKEVNGIDLLFMIEVEVCEHGKHYTTNSRWVTNLGTKGVSEKVGHNVVEDIHFLGETYVLTLCRIAPRHDSSQLSRFLITNIDPISGIGALPFGVTQSLGEKG